MAKASFRPILLAALAPLALSGCVAAVLPIAAGGMLAKAERDRDGETRTLPSAPVTGSNTVPETTAAPGPVAAAPAPYLAEGPRPDSVAPPAYTAFAAHVLASADTNGDAPLLSVVPAYDWTVEDPARMACDGTPPAVIIDLDPGARPFIPAKADMRPVPGLSGVLAQMRRQGIAVLWASVLPPARAEEIYDALAAAGLDPSSTDHLLLSRAHDETKTARRREAAADYCIIAIAGDRKGDFDMLFDFLKNPDSPTPFDTLIGDGWFLMDPPLD